MDDDMLFALLGPGGEIVEVSPYSFADVLRRAQRPIHVLAGADFPSPQMAYARMIGRFESKLDRADHDLAIDGFRLARLQWRVDAALG